LERRQFITVLSSAMVAWPVAVSAQQASKPLIGFLRAGRPPKAWLEAFQQGLREQGYVDGQNVIVEVRFTDGSLDRLPQLVDELVRLKVHVIVASGSSAAAAAKKGTTSVPIVFASVSYPVETGLVASLARPGGNITGMAFNSADLAGKRLELLRELVPTLKHVAVLSHPGHPTDQVQLEGTEVAARTLGMRLKPVPVLSPSAFDSAFEAVRGTDGLLYLDGPFFTTHRVRLAGLTAASRLAAVYGYREMVTAGGLMSYGPQIADFHRRAATHVNKILKGAKPADLPVEQPTKFELVINLKTAKALGLTIPPTLLARADDAIE
jgi:putative ABC transport system substrate-binding protein